MYASCESEEADRKISAMTTVGSFPRRGFTLVLSAILLLLALFVVVILVDAAREDRALLQDTDGAQVEGWWKELNSMEGEARQFQREANDKSVDELAHLTHVRDLLKQLRGETNSAAQSASSEEVSWSYGSGFTGPIFWGNLSSGFQLCASGTSQSPVNIELNLKAADLPSLGWVFPGSSPLRVNINRGNSSLIGREFYNGHTFEVEEFSGPTMTVGGLDYTLEEFHFHTPSEHTVAGRHYDAEIQFVHSRQAKTEMLGNQGDDSVGENDDGGLSRLVVSAFFEKVSDGVRSSVCIACAIL